MIDAALARLDGVAQAALCTRGEVSADELRQAALARIAALDPLLGAVVTVSHARSVASAGPLHGVPLLVKDSTPWPGLRWSMGSRLFRNHTTQQQTPYGRRLVEAGGQCVGKTSTSEFGLLFSTETLLEGATLNPWDLSRSAGGSSGGSAVAVAAGLVPIAHANDGGGSLRVPASMCGVVGFKPSRGRTVAAALTTNDFIGMTSDHCITRSVRDSALVLSLTEDATHDRVGWVREPIDRSLRIATWTGTLRGAVADPAVLDAHRATVQLLQDLGHIVEFLDAPDVGEALVEALFLVAGGAVADVVDQVDRTRTTAVQQDELEPFTWALHDAFQARGAQALPASRAAFAAASAQYRERTAGFDVLMTPTLATEPWPLGHLSPVHSLDALIARTGRSVGYTPIQNIAGCPAISLPLHVGPSGLPIGMHFAADRGADALLLRLAYQLEDACPWRDRWPPFSIPLRFGAE